MNRVPALGDDSGVELEALNGSPGLDTAPYTKQHGGRELVFELWASLLELRANPRATFVCVLVLAWPDGHYEQFDARVSGPLSFPARGHDGHGYDSIFIPYGHL